MKGLENVARNIAQVDVSRSKDWSERRITGQHFFVKAFLIGLFVALVIGGGLFCRYQYAPSYSFQPNYHGFGIAHNQTQSYIPYLLIVRVSLLTEKPILYFRYYFSVEENGSYNFIFFFPFAIFQKIGSTESLKFNSTPHGSAVWIRHQVLDVGSWKSDYIWGEFYVNKTFQSGTRGKYSFALPFVMGVDGSNVIDQLQHELGLSWQSPAGRVELEFMVPSHLQIIQAYPQSFSGPDTLEIFGNRTVNKVYWNVSWLNQQFTIICRDGQEIAHYQSLLFFSGIFISIGSGLMVRSGYDAIKERSGKQHRSYSKADYVLIFIFFLLFSLVIFDVLTPIIRFIFEPTELGQSWYSLVSGVLILFIGILWGASKIADQIKPIKSYREHLRTIFSKASSFIGLTKVNKGNLSYILLSIFIGMLFNFLTLYGAAVFRGGSLYVKIPSVETYLTIQYLVVAPLFEELVFRGIYLSSFLRILGKNYLSATLGLIMSSFTFGWIHHDIFLSLVIKTSGGFLLGIIYLFKWRRNFMAAFSAHFGFNLVGIFLYVS